MAPMLSSMQLLTALSARKADLEFYPPTKIKVAQSPGKGLGVFATEAISAGEVIECAPVHSLSSEDESLRDYQFCYPKSLNYREQVLAWGYGSLYNHSSEPNCCWRNHPEFRGFEYYALRDIHPGEELLINYGGTPYWQNGRDHVEVVEPERSYAYFSLSPDDMAKQLSEAGIPCYNLISNPMDFDYYNVKQFPTLLVLDENKNVIGQTSGRGKILAVINRKKLLESS